MELPRETMRDSGLQGSAPPGGSGGERIGATSSHLWGAGALRFVAKANGRDTLPTSPLRLRRRVLFTPMCSTVPLRSST